MKQPTAFKRTREYANCPVNVSVVFVSKEMILTSVQINSGPLFWKMRKQYPNRNIPTWTKDRGKQTSRFVQGLALAFEYQNPIKRWMEWLRTIFIKKTKACRWKERLNSKKIRKALREAKRVLRYYQSLNKSNDRMTAVANNAAREGPRHIQFDSDSTELMVDTGASHHIWKDKKAFIEYRPFDKHELARERVQGVSGKIQAEGIGTVEISLEDDVGNSHIVHLRDVRYVPECPENLFVPQCFSQQREEEGDHSAHCDTRSSGMNLEWTAEDGSIVSKFIPLSASNVGVTRTRPSFDGFSAYAALFKGFSSTNYVSDDEGSDDEREEELPEPTAMPTKELRKEPFRVAFKEKEAPNRVHDNDEPLLESDERLLMEWHERLGHASFERLKVLAHHNIIPKKLLRCKTPKCPGCLYGKAHRKPWRTKGKQKSIRVAKSAGEIVSVDQLESPIPGFLPISKGSPTKRRYVAATVFADHFSGFTYVHFMEAITTDETIEAKEAFERFAERHGVRVQHYHCDNGRFADKAFLENVREHRQTISFCGVSAHHQNGVAEKRIRDVTESARSMLLHAVHRWPKTITANLWPQAVAHAVNIRNALPVAVGKSCPLSTFAGTDIQPNLKHFHPFGCPVYVLENALQSGNPHPKWSDRSRVGIFLCHSPNHATNVPMVLNTQTGMVSPQFHCVYDNSFDTVAYDKKNQSLWQHKARLSDSTDELYDETLVTERSRPQGFSLEEYLQKEVPASLLQSVQEQDVSTSDGASPPQQTDTNPGPGQTNDGSTDKRPSSTPEKNVPDTRIHQETEVPVTQIAPQGTTRSGRTVKPRQKLTYAARWIQTFQDFHPLATLKAFASTKQRDPDTMTLERALKEPDAEQFIEAMEKEIDDHTSRGHWIVVPLSKVPRHKKMIPMVWSMKRKRDPAGNVLKHKARLCAHGGMSVYGEDYWDTYSPVVSWATVRLVLIMALILNWHMRSIDFVMAFPQADVKTDIFMRLPKGSKLPGGKDPRRHALKLIKNLYGLKDAGRTWADYAKEGLLKAGFKQSNYDPCLFMKGKVLLTLYVDDAAIFSPYKDEIDKVIKHLQKDYVLTDEGDLKDYLGVRFEKRADGSIKMHQNRVIKRALEILGIPIDGDVKMHDTPAESTKILHKDENGPTRKQSWNYRSAIGVLNYLQGMTRPDLSYAVHQCARFCENPKLSHEQAVKRVCRYLRATKDDGLIFTPDMNKGFECYADADWAGNWNKDHNGDDSCVKSRTGYLITYAGCPIIWGSKLQQLIALSSTEAEVICLSTALREVISMQNLLIELRDFGIPVPFTHPNIHCKTFEDNTACIELAKEAKLRPRTKHLACRLFHFRQHVEKGLISIHYVNTKNQIADIFTKPLPRVQFQELRKKFMGW